jgi:Ni,Fe-hydrogenase III large subunit
MIEQAIERMPAGPLHGDDLYAVPPGEAIVRIEAPRGEVFYYVESDGSDTVARLKIRTPTFLNIPTVQSMVKGNAFADIPLIQASVDPCYSCTDR